jgi:hypothetical protein
MSKQTIWMLDEVGANYHADHCKCPHHCQHCWENLLTPAYPNPRTRYCSDYCRDYAKRDRALTRLLEAS